MAGGYLLLAAGLTGVSISGIATILVGPRTSADGFSSLGFGLFALAGFLIVSAVAAVNVCVPKIRFDVDAGNGRGKLAA
jgi:cytochrome c oxidase subunit I